MTMITPSYLGETIEYSSLHACRSTLEDPTDDPATSYGFGWRITGDTVWHSGESVGFRNVIVRWPRRRLTVIVLTNRSEPEPYSRALRLVEAAAVG